MPQDNKSSIELFAPDKFSNPKMEWFPMSDKNEDNIELKTVLENNYFDIFNSLESISSAGSFNINSSNYLIDTNRHSFVIKKINSNKIKKVKYLCEVDTKIASLFNKTPSVIKNDYGLKFFKYNENYYILYKKIGNSHYYGDKKEFDMFLDTFLNFKNLVKNNNIKLSHIHQVINKKSLQRLNNFYANKNDIKFNSLEILNQHKEIILSSISSIDISPDNISNLNVYHIDLHPHNLSIDGDNLYFLDLDSFQMTTIERSLGFALYKLLRQSYSICKNYEASSFINSDKLKAICNHGNINLSSLKAGASYEILRRILIISDEIIEKNQSIWEFMLPSHIRGLYEIDILFES